MQIVEVSESEQFQSRGVVNQESEVGVWNYTSTPNMRIFEVLGVRDWSLESKIGVNLIVIE